ncbi:hypothetical protein M0R04_14190, partial [Candidatus Dojkabacteria bacterium]|nr:hypothetical protein [Candidatus Dojkabacteria bacterium]
VLYVNAGAGEDDIGGAFTATGAAPAKAGNIIILQVFQDGTTNGAVTQTSATNITALDGTANTWTAITEQTVGASDEGRHYLWIGRSTGTSAPTFTGGNSTSEDVWTRMYEFTGCDANATTLAGILENATAGTVANGSATDTSVTDTSVQTLGDGRLALNFIAVNASQAAELTAMTGETGGDWTYPVAAFGSTTGTDGTIALVTAAMASAGTINGGSDAITSRAWGVIGFALIPELSPTVVLTTPTDAATGQSVTPALIFTGTDGNADEVEYQVQVDTSSSFNSGSTVNTYYFDAHIAGPTDSGAVWTDDASGFDSDATPSTFAYTTGILVVLSGTGTTAPTSGNAITQVRARMFGGQSAGTQTQSAPIYNGADLLGTPITHSGAALYEWGDYVTLSAPAGGWTWTIVNGLKVDATSANASTVTKRIYKVEIEVTSDSPLLDILSSTDADANWTGTGAPNPFPSGNAITYTIPAASTLTAGLEYFWRVRAIDPLGSNTWGAYPTRFSFTTAAAGGDKSVNVFDSITVAETVTPQLVSNINVFDTINVSETVTPQLVSNVNVFDSINVSESTIPQVVNNVDVFDTVNVSEAVTIMEANLVINVSDDVFVSESVQTQKVLNINVFDSVTVDDGNGVSTPGPVLSEVSNISVVDTVNVSESTTPQLISNINVFDSITVAETVTTFLPFLAVNVFDSITVAETIASQLVNNISVVDNITVAESTNAGIPLTLDVFDSITVSETITPQLVNNVSVVDNITVSESTVASEVLNISVFDSIQVSEQISAQVPNQFLNVFDNITVSESITPQLNNLINVFDSVTVGETTTLHKINNIDVFDSIAVSENIQLRLDNNISVFDFITVAETTTVSLSLNIDVFDGITVSENISAIIPSGSANVFDSIGVSESTVPQLVNNINVFDTVQVSEGIQTQGVFRVDVFDTINVSESIVASEIHNVSVFDNVQVSESITPQKVNNINVVDNVTVSENIVAQAPIVFIDVFDNVVVSENVSVLEITPSGISVVDDVYVSESVSVLIPILHIDIFDSIVVSENLVAQSVGIFVNVFDSIQVSEDVSVSSSAVVIPPTTGFKHLPHRLSRLGRMSH